MWGLPAAVRLLRVSDLLAREIKVRYKGSLLGLLWAWLSPLGTVLVLHVLFTRIVPLQIPHYAAFVYSGLLPWTWFSTALNESAGVLISGGNLIKKVLFPAEVLPIVSVLTNMVHFFFGLPILGVFLAYYIWSPATSIDPANGQVIVHQVALHWQELVWLPVVILVQLILTTGLALPIARRTSATTASGRAGLRTKDEHPAARASRDASSDVCPVIATIGM